MAPESPPWLVRWQQRKDDELLYVDQTLTPQEQYREGMSAAVMRRDMMEALRQYCVERVHEEEDTTDAP